MLRKTALIAKNCASSTSLHLVQEWIATQRAVGVFDGHGQGALKHVLGEPGHVRSGQYIVARKQGVIWRERFLCKHIEAGQ